MRGYAKTIIIGNVGGEPDVRVFGNDKKVTIRVAVSTPGYTAKSGQQIPEKTEWYNVVVTGATANFAADNIHKGDAVLAEGAQASRKYTDGAGIERTTWELKTSRFELLRSAGNASSAPAEKREERASEGVSAEKMHDLFDSMTSEGAGDLPFDF